MSKSARRKAIKRERYLRKRLEAVAVSPSAAMLRLFGLRSSVETMDNGDGTFTHRFGGE